MQDNHCKQTLSHGKTNIYLANLTLRVLYIIVKFYLLQSCVSLDIIAICRPLLTLNSRFMKGVVFERLSCRPIKLMSMF